MKRLYISLLVLVLSLGLGLGAYAKDVKSPGAMREEGKTPAATREDGKFVHNAGDMTYKASDLIGAKVENPQGETLGKIDNLAIDPKTGRVAFAVLSEGGVAGVGSKYFAVPLRSLSLRTDDNGKVKMFVLNMSKDRLANAPSFDQNSWPDKKKTEESYRYFGMRPSWHGKTVSHTKTTK